MKHFFFSLSFLVLFITAITPLQGAKKSSAIQKQATAQSSSHQGEAPPSSLNIGSFPADAVEEVVVPLPSEIFKVLDQLGTPDWKSFLRTTKTPTPEDRAHIALLLGSVIAEGFIAVEAKEAFRVKELGRDILSLAEAINVRESVISRSKSIIEKADHADWRAARQEFDGALQDVKAAMTEMNDQDLAQLVSLGGWLRGTEILTSVIDAHYTLTNAELLHQPELIRYFMRCLNGMPPRLKKNKLVNQTSDLLHQLLPLVETKNAPIKGDKINKIQRLTTDLLSKINQTSS